MRSKGVIDKRIAAITQTRFYNDNTGRFAMSVSRIELEDGTVLIPCINETPVDYSLDFSVIKPDAWKDVRPR